MTDISLPALRSDDPLGFLAALGVVELSSSALNLATRLRWDGLGGEAILEADVENLDDLAGRLAVVAQDLSGSDRLAPAGDTHLIEPPLNDADRKRRAEASGSKGVLDPMRMSREEVLARFAVTQQAELSDDAGTARWTSGLVNQLGQEQNDPRCDLTPLYARTGRQNLHQLYRDYLLAVSGHPSLLREALAGWRRVAGDSGANLDHRALRDAVLATNGKPSNAAVPGATWLALMAVPWFRLSGSGLRPSATGWLSTRPGGRPRALVWPVWRQPLEPEAIEVLLSHPLVGAAARRSLESSDASLLAALGVDAVMWAVRRTLGNSDGPLGPGEVRWTAP